MEWVPGLDSLAENMFFEYGNEHSDYIKGGEFLASWATMIIFMKTSEMS
jgi:hypothetical protein